MSEPKKERKISRRDFLIIVGVAGGGLLLGTKVGLPFARLKVAELFDSGAAPGGLDAEATAWFQIIPENKIKLFIPKVEMGKVSILRWRKLQRRNWLLSGSSFRWCRPALAKD